MRFLLGLVACLLLSTAAVGGAEAAVGAGEGGVLALARAPVGRAAPACFHLLILILLLRGLRGGIRTVLGPPCARSQRRRWEAPRLVHRRRGFGRVRLRSAPRSLIPGASRQSRRVLARLLSCGQGCLRGGGSLLGRGLWVVALGELGRERQHALPFGALARDEALRLRGGSGGVQRSAGTIGRHLATRRRARLARCSRGAPFVTVLQATQHVGDGGAHVLVVASLRRHKLTVRLPSGRLRGCHQLLQRLQLVESVLARRLHAGEDGRLRAAHALLGAGQVVLQGGGELPCERPAVGADRRHQRHLHRVQLGRQRGLQVRQLASEQPPDALLHRLRHLQ
mmetsp:Transcript_19868/g.37900  ORF Transcript_19868/g.37900 Transcript_19868/m.37900 type:complete len:339 (-) Transcript_19868:2390-3406(-)